MARKNIISTEAAQYIHNNIEIQLNQKISPHDLRRNVMPVVIA